LTENNTGTSLNRGNVVSFYYSISLLDGTVLQSISKENGDKPLQFCLLSNTMVPEGVDYGISLMKVGEKYQFFVPSYLAYGSYSCAYFQVNSNFIVDIEVTDVETENDFLRDK
jgi:FKBP-type peptidyl-prolyl cis-trans isomerase